MAAITKLVKFRNIYVNKSGLFFTAVRHHWNKDFKPGPYPRTEEERAKAAKKYGLTLEEYEPYPDDGAGHGDYPKLPLVSGEGKDPYYPYDYPEIKRNFNEPIHIHAEMIGEDRYDVSAKLRWPAWQQTLVFLGVMFGTGAVYLYLERMKMFRPVLEKQYPASGKKHYTFEKP